MPKFKAVILYTRYQHVTFDAKDVEEAKANATNFWDENRPSNGDDYEWEVRDLTQIKSKKRVKEVTNPMRPKEKGFTKIKLNILPLGN